jgi:hypothetical protein
LLLLQLPSADLLQQLPKLNNPREDAAATEFCKSTVATTKIKHKRMSNEFGRRSNSNNSSNRPTKFSVASYTD